MLSISGHEGPEYRGVLVRACIRVMDGRCGGDPETGGDWSIMCGLHFPPRNAHAVQPGTAHLPPPWRMHRLLDRASVVHPGSVQDMLLCLLRMPPDFDMGLQPGAGTSWCRLHRLLRETCFVHSGITHL